MRGAQCGHLDGRAIESNTSSILWGVQCITAASSTPLTLLYNPEGRRTCQVPSEPLTPHWVTANKGRAKLKAQANEILGHRGVNQSRHCHERLWKKKEQEANPKGMKKRGWGKSKTFSRLSCKGGGWQQRGKFRQTRKSFIISPWNGLSLTEKLSSCTCSLTDLLWKE